MAVLNAERERCFIEKKEMLNWGLLFAEKIQRESTKPE